MNSISLAGIDGQHLWGFLTALGSLSLLDEHAREHSLGSPRLSFRQDGTAVLQSPTTREELASVLFDKLMVLKTFLNANNLAEIKKPSDFTSSNYENIAGPLLEDPTKSGDEKIARSSAVLTTVNLIAGLACVVGEDTSESTLCAANGASHQNLVQSMRDVLALVDTEHIRMTLFEPWRRAYRVPDNKREELALNDRKPTLRLDPSDERLYAYRYSSPTKANDFSTELGAQALAIPAFALLPVVPGKQPVTVASKRSGPRVTFSWVLWNVPTGLRTARSLVWAGAGSQSEQRERGVFAAYSADRVSGTKGKLSFAPSQGVW